MSLNKVIATGQISHVFSEKKILSSLRYPFIVEMYFLLFLTSLLLIKKNAENATEREKDRRLTLPKNLFQKLLYVKLTF